MTFLNLLKDKYQREQIVCDMPGSKAKNHSNIYTTWRLIKNNLTQKNQSAEIYHKSKPTRKTIAKKLQQCLSWSPLTSLHHNIIFT